MNMLTTCRTALLGLALIGQLACGPLTLRAGAEETDGYRPPSYKPAREFMPADEARAHRYNGTVAIWFTSHYQVDSRDWDNIQEFKGPFHPRLGYYKSDDPAVLRQQLRWLRRAGIDAIVYDVFSTGKWKLTDLPRDKTLQLLVKELSHQEQESRTLRLIIWLEKYLSNPTAEEYRYALAYVRQHLAGRDFYYRYHGAPLIVAYRNGPSNVVGDDFRQIERENKFFAIHRIRPYASADWSYIQQYPQPFNYQWMPVSPGIDPALENAYIAKYVSHQTPAPLRFAPRDEKFFQTQLLRARQEGPEIIFVSGWNDWQYGCQIEPAKEYGFRYVDMAARFLGREAETAPYRQEKKKGKAP